MIHNVSGLNEFRDVRHLCHFQSFIYVPFFFEIIGIDPPGVFEQKDSFGGPFVDREGARESSSQATTCMCWRSRGIVRGVCAFAFSVMATYENTERESAELCFDLRASVTDHLTAYGLASFGALFEFMGFFRFRRGVFEGIFRSV